MKEIARRYLKLPEYCQLTGMSASTVRRRVRDGSIACYQPGGPNHLLLFDAAAISHLPKTHLANPNEADSTGTDGNVGRDPQIDQSGMSPKHRDQRGNGPKWKRELAALAISTLQTSDK